LLAPVVFFVLTKTPSHPPVIGPTTPPPTTSPSPSAVPIATRTIAIPGITLKDRPDVQFVDGRHAWLWYDGCRAPDPVPDCGHVLAASEDGGTTWRTVKLPQLPKRSTVVMFPLDASTLAFRVTQEMADTPTNYWLTTDGGATFASYPLSNPPRLALLAAAGEFYFRCPGATGLEDGAWGVTCDKEELARAGRGRVTPQPPLRSAAMVLNGADGRVWLVDDSEPRLLLSDDQAKTWREIPRPGMVPIVLSPDGKQVWAIAPTGLLELVGDQWQSRMTMPTEGVRPLLPLNDGLWLVPHGSGIAYLKDGKFTPIPGLPAGAYAHALRDGTVVVGTGTGAYVGVGNAMDRQWFIVG